MRDFLQKQRLMQLVAATMLTLVSSPLLAQTDQTGRTDSLAALKSHYPAGSIQSEEMADRALQDVKTLRANIKERYDNEKRACFREHFFANHCNSEAYKRRNSALNETEEVRLEAKRYKRRAALDRREKKLSEKQKNHHQEESSEPKSMHVSLNRNSGSKAHHETLSNEEQARNQAAYARKLQRYEERKRKLAEKQSRKATKNKP